MPAEKKGKRPEGGAADMNKRICDYVFPGTSCPDSVETGLKKEKRREHSMFYITGDTHGEFSRIERFCERIEPRQDDTMIILGDAGIFGCRLHSPTVTAHVSSPDARSLPGYCPTFVPYKKPPSLCSYSALLWRHCFLQEFSDNPLFTSTCHEPHIPEFRRPV